MPSPRRIGLTIGFALVFGLFSLCVAYAVDTASDKDDIRRNVVLAGSDIGGLSEDQLRSRLNDLGNEYRNTAIIIGSKERFSIPARAVELELNEDATARSALQTGRSGNFPGRVANWTKSFVRPQPVAVTVTFDSAALRESVRSGDTSERVEPTEPGFEIDNDRLTAVAGKSGRGIDAEAVGNKLGDAATLGAPLAVSVAPGEIEPRFDQEDAQRLAESLERDVVKAVPASAGGRMRDIGPDRIRKWLTTTAGNDSLQAAVKTEAVMPDLEETFKDAGQKSVEARFDVVGSTPVVLDGQPGAACCAPEAGQLVTEIIEARIEGSPLADVVDLPLKSVDPQNTGDSLRSLNINQPIGSFTTSYAPGQPRVSNIHRISDLTRGSFVRPGQTFSINNAVGPRTIEKGFVSDGVIMNGEFQEAVGGGISQYATTLFNAAFFAGLDFGEYQAHTIYISRYPYGREATVSFPHPDLVIRNTTPNGVLVWPTYTNSSVTVTLYSSPYASGEQTGQSESKVGECTKVTTQRTRKYVDGRSSIDSVQAIYQPEEGKRC